MILPVFICSVLDTALVLLFYVLCKLRGSDGLEWPFVIVFHHTDQGTKERTMVSTAIPALEADSTWDKCW